MSWCRACLLPWMKFKEESAIAGWSKRSDTSPRSRVLPKISLALPHQVCTE